MKNPCFAEFPILCSRKLCKTTVLLFGKRICIQLEKIVKPFKNTFNCQTMNKQKYPSEENAKACYSGLSKFSGSEELNFTLSKILCLSVGGNV